MKSLICVIYDTKARVYNLPFYQTNKDVLQRTCMTLLADTQSEISKHPEDYSVFILGEYDDSAASLELYPTLEHFINFHELIGSNIDD